MDGNNIAIISLIVVNTGVVAYSYGRLTQKVTDLCRRIDKVEKLINKKPDTNIRGFPGK